MTEAQLNSIIKKASRIARKNLSVLRRDASNLDRLLDRVIARKTLIKPKDWNPVIIKYNNLKTMFPIVEKNLADSISATNI